jgi:hypothetical protein
MYRGRKNSKFLSVKNIKIPNTKNTKLRSGNKGNSKKKIEEDKGEEE